MDVIGNQWQVEKKSEPFPCKEEENVEEQMEQIFRKHQWVETSALVNRILVICFQLVEGNNVENGEKYEEGIDDEGEDVGQGCKGEGHGQQQGKGEEGEGVVGEGGDEPVAAELVCC